MDTPTTVRPMKCIRINYAQNVPSRHMAAFSIFGDPAEARMSVNNGQFVAVNEKTGVSMSPGFGKQINIQALPHNMRYGGILMDLPFPLSVIPVTPFTPFPNQLFVPPMLGLVPTLLQIALILGSMPV